MGFNSGFKGLINPNCKNQLVTKCCIGPETWTDGLEGLKEWKKHVTLRDSKHLQILGGEI